MTWVILGFILLTGYSLYQAYMSDKYLVFIVSISISILAIFGIKAYDKYSQVGDYEIYSGMITSVLHKEEWDEWIPPKTETYTVTDSNGKKQTKTKVIPGYWVHHNAENYITTSDNGTQLVYETLEGKRFSDYFVNSTKELEEYYPIGMNTASVHIFENRLKLDSTIFNIEINLDDYIDELPQRPFIINNRLTVDRLIGDFKNKNELLRELDSINSNLNDTNNPNNVENIKGYKQVNIMFVNFGDKTQDYGYALQNYWNNGAKNDFVITFGTDENNKPTWCYVFSWSDVEILKTDVREYIMNKDNLNDFKSIMYDISDMVEEKYERKQFSEFDYIQVEMKSSSIIITIIIFIIIGIISTLFYIND